MVTIQKKHLQKLGFVQKQTQAEILILIKEAQLKNMLMENVGKKTKKLTKLSPRQIKSKNTIMLKSNLN